MAEQVQIHLEKRLPELQDLFKKGVYTEGELRDIVGHRTKYEYRLKRRGAILEDFLAYIEYEKQLEVDRRDRIKRFGIKMKHSISDHSILEHIYGLYQRALVKFKGNTTLWMQFLEYALSQGGRKVFVKGVARALQVHPLNERFWIMAAEFEWYTNGNMKASRAVLQRGLRVLPSSIPLFEIFFKLELDFASKLIERRKILGIDDAPSNDDDVCSGAVACLVYEHMLNSIDNITLSNVAPLISKAISMYSVFPDLYEKMISMTFDQVIPSKTDGEAIMAMFYKETIDSTYLRLSLSFLEKLLKKFVSEQSYVIACRYLKSLLDGASETDHSAIKEAIESKIGQLIAVSKELELFGSEMQSFYCELRPEDRQSNPQKVQSHVSHKILSIPNLIKRSQQIVDPDAYVEQLEIILAQIVTSKISASAKFNLFLKCFPSHSASLAQVALEIMLPVLESVQGIASIRLFLDSIKSKTLLGENIIMKFIDYLSMNASDDYVLLKSIFEQAVLISPKSKPIWIKFVALERQFMKFAEASQVIHRAKMLAGLQDHDFKQ